MISRPIIPVWIMSIICIAIIIIIINNKTLLKKIKANEKTARQDRLRTKYFIDVIIKVLIVGILFIMNLRFMVPNGESTVINSNLNVLFVIDTTVSMSALDYDVGRQRIEAVKEDCEHIIDELGRCRYSVITFDNEAKRLIPFTTDNNMAIATIKTLIIQDSTSAKGTTLNIVKDVMKKTIDAEEKRKNGTAEFVVFFISDGEITKENEKLESFSEMSTHIKEGAVLGYGTNSGGKMRETSYYDDTSTSYLKYYDPQTYDDSDAISKIDESNLKKVATDLGVDYIKMDKQSNINEKIKSVKASISKSNKEIKKNTTYKDIYYYFALPLIILLFVELILQKRRFL